MAAIVWVIVYLFFEKQQQEQKHFSDETDRRTHTSCGSTPKSGEQCMIEWKRTWEKMLRTRRLQWYFLVPWKHSSICTCLESIAKVIRTFWGVLCTLNQACWQRSVESKCDLCRIPRNFVFPLDFSKNDQTSNGNRTQCSIHVLHLKYKSRKIGKNYFCTGWECPKESFTFVLNITQTTIGPMVPEEAPLCAPLSVKHRSIARKETTKRKTDAA